MYVASSAYFVLQSLWSLKIYTLYHVTHEGKKPFKCTKCGNGFSESGYLKTQWSTQVTSNSSAQSVKIVSLYHVTWIHRGDPQGWEAIQLHKVW